MRKLTSFLLILSVVVSCKDSKKEQSVVSEDTSTTIYYLIRHAEKDRSDPTNKNPKLTTEGMQRAQNWAKYFDTIKIDQVFSTNYIRTMETASFTASQKNVMIELYDPKDLYNNDFKALTKGHNVLIVGHSDTTPKFVNAIIGENTYPDIDDAENGHLFIVTVTGDTKNVQLLTID